MPCMGCGARQTDPVRGASTWKRGVAGGEQVLVCPACQSTPDWFAGLDTCAACGSVVLVKALGEVLCRSCGATGGTGAQPRPPQRDAALIRPAESPEPQAHLGALHDEVDAAIGRVLSRPVDPGGRPWRRRPTGADGPPGPPTVG